jgi:hypothetical protein
MAFTKLKPLLQAKAERSVGALWDTLSTLIKSLEPN